MGELESTLQVQHDTLVHLGVSFINKMRNQVIISSCFAEPYATFWEQVLSSFDIPQCLEG